MAIIAEYPYHSISFQLYSIQSITIVLSSLTLGSFHKKLEALKAKEDSLKNGLALFSMEAPIYKDLALTQSDLGFLEQVWNLTNEWDIAWQSWKAIKFQELNVPQLEEQAQKVGTNITSHHTRPYHTTIQHSIAHHHSMQHHTNTFAVPKAHSETRTRNQTP